METNFTFQTINLRLLTLMVARILKVQTYQSHIMAQIPMIMTIVIPTLIPFLVMKVINQII